ncbi:MAG: redoxin domain-containing protein [Planctomycetes bacterium]|nr:redoxin domain-containing protein [Planctomycetota bacterium]
MPLSSTDASRRIVSRRWRALLAVALVLLVGTGAVLAWRIAHEPPRIDWSRARSIEPLELPSFELVDLDGATCSRSDLEGRVWILDLVSLQCGACGPTSGSLADLQERLAGAEIGFVTVSISREDGVGALRSHQRSYRRADPQRWRILLCDETYAPRLAVLLGAAGSERHVLAGLVAPRPRFFLVDREARVRGAFDARRPAELDQLVADALALARSAP